MDIENELAAVVFDEIHYIGDKHRGTVWEETLMMLPKHITIIGLSATISHPEPFVIGLKALTKKCIYALIPNASFLYITICF